ncbi:TIGR04283 family arsenosugar biosynthesis glycosyltransferase [Marinobacterium arenosum]|uniref:TIGR04283 family arsenosugar biosynthesis glycosyltransferase n=1 Tax=Marinobacterium arenosum TaxID=2862496 RepID=UPI001C955668|nr:TIGR04283 family arsenosugar biosynthesis glycosyltransferase [Marinobacterium arenosum]MBY4678478.1 TIGR04283 family arsenosugar biosynthesis glycosyltransferase [Marinobacterium arenosum]
MPKPLSIIVPMLNEAAVLSELLEHLRYWQPRGCEILLVDGGSSDGSADIAEAAGFRVVHAPRGRARQMNAGAEETQGEVLLFLHADTRLPQEADRRLLAALQSGDKQWGRFDVRLSGNAAMLPLIATMMNLRSRLSGIATGDQAIFVRRPVFEQVGGFPEQPLMEDIELSARLKRFGAPLCLRDRVLTSGRRWESRGVWKTILLMWRLRWAYWRGADPARLAQLYR